MMSMIYMFICTRLVWNNFTDDLRLSDTIENLKHSNADSKLNFERLQLSVSPAIQVTVSAYEWLRAT